MRPSHGGGVGPLDLLQPRATRRRRRRRGGGRAQVSAAAALRRRPCWAPLGEIVVASFVCREHTTTLGGRLFVTQTHVGFSPCGVGPDHPHDAHGATVAKIEHVTRAWTRGSGTAAAALHVSLVGGRDDSVRVFRGRRARERSGAGGPASVRCRESTALAVPRERGGVLAPASSALAMLHGETTRRVVRVCRRSSSNRERRW